MGGLCAGPARVRDEEEVDFRPRGLGVLERVVLGSLERVGDSGAELAAERLVDLLRRLGGEGFVGVEVREGGRSGSGNWRG